MSEQPSFHEHIPDPDAAPIEGGFGVEQMYPPEDEASLLRAVGDKIAASRDSVTVLRSGEEGAEMLVLYPNPNKQSEQIRVRAGEWTGPGRTLEADGSNQMLVTYVGGRSAGTGNYTMGPRGVAKVSEGRGIGQPEFDPVSLEGRADLIAKIMGASTERPLSRLERAKRRVLGRMAIDDGE